MNKKQKKHLEDMGNFKKKIQVIIFKKRDSSIEYLSLKLNQKRGGLWQPITAKVEEKENLKEALIRELKEEVNVESYERIIENIYEFTYPGKSENFIETVFAVQIKEKTLIDINKNPCDEHVDYLWSSYDGTFELYEYYTQKEALTKLHKILLNEK